MPDDDLPDGPLLDTAALRRLLATPDPPTLLDVRWVLATGSDPGAYREAHLPGARFVALDTELAGPPGAGGRHPLPDAGDFEQAMRRAGVRDGHPVVCYDAGPGMSAARAWWLLRLHGHRRVFVLDGGLAAWEAAGNETESGDPGPVPPGDFTRGPSEVAVLEVDDVLGAARDGVLLDARAQERYLGLTEPIDPVAGHVPGAISAPTTENVGPDGRFLAAEELRDRFAALGVDGGQLVAAYCGSGVTAAHEVLALEVAGYRAALYPGSWSHWISDPDRPVATGDPQDTH